MGPAQREWRTNWYNAPHYAVVMKYAKIVIVDKTLFVQTDAGRVGRRIQRRNGFGEEPARLKTIVFHGNVSAPRREERVCTTL